MAQTGEQDSLAEARAQTDAALEAMPQGEVRTLAENLVSGVRSGLSHEQAQHLADVARARSTDGRVAGGLERVVRMAQSAALVHEATSLAAIRPDLADEEQYVDPDRKARILKGILIRPTGPRWRESRVGIVRRRVEMGLS